MKILCDLDGVLADFVSASYEVHGKEAEQAIKWNYFEDWNLGPGEFFGEIRKYKDFWRNLNPYPWKNSLVREICKYDPEFLIMTKPDDHYNSWGGKFDWIGNHLNISRADRIMMGGSKHLLAAPNRVLIDDNDKNIEMWRDHGGIGILFPQLYNDNMLIVGDRIQYVTNQLKIIANKLNKTAEPT